MKHFLLILIFVLSISLNGYCEKNPSTEEIKLINPAVRVWRGYKKEGVKTEIFLKKLSEVFIPATAMFQKNFGLKAYIPVITPMKKTESIPDEIALVFYESKEKYGESFSTVAGRTYGDLHGTIFSYDEVRKSKSSWPEYFEKDLKTGIPFFLFNKDVNWQNGGVRVFIIEKKEETSVDKFQEYINKKIDELKNKPPHGMDNCIGVFENNYLILFEHYNTRTMIIPQEIEEMHDFSKLIMFKEAIPLWISSTPFELYEGIGKITEEIIFNIQF